MLVCLHAMCLHVCRRCIAKAAKGALAQWPGLVCGLAGFGWTPLSDLLGWPSVAHCCCCSVMPGLCRAVAGRGSARVTRCAGSLRQETDRRRRHGAGRLRVSSVPPPPPLDCVLLLRLQGLDNRPPIVTRLMRFCGLYTQASCCGTAETARVLRSYRCACSPSQIRFVDYFAQVVKAGMQPPKKTPMCLLAVRIFSTPKVPLPPAEGKTAGWGSSGGWRALRRTWRWTV